MTTTTSLIIVNLFWHKVREDSIHLEIEGDANEIYVDIGHWKKGGRERLFVTEFGHPTVKQVMIILTHGCR